ncbi:MAG: hypothetical protein [Bacteriophage sp.]|nr:MAG: hypothetical protein [Bacteriophage sp.]UVM91525.1 MAG: hypothetical protein [Bacteriophage sp.]UVN01780.1 MAG: hypothetical protein [Bacteriophage sp.]UVX34552.1 MAG: hypothetical protein [Bacteriophage sp.]UVX36012.1 MAG: hypothetical protein [Bacteriophage sp.]
MNIGNVVELKRDNLNGIGNKGDKGVLLYKLYKPVDGWEYMVKLYNGSTEAFLEKDLKLAVKTIDKINIAW